MPKSANKNKKSNTKTTKKTQQEKKIDSLLSKQILLKEQVEFYKKHSNAKTLIIIFIILVLILMWLYLNDYSNAYLSELQLVYFSKGIAKANSLSF